MSCVPDFPRLSIDDYQRVLRLPTSATKPLRVAAPIPTASKMWQPNPGGHPMREAYEISVNAIFPTFERQLQARG